MSNQQDSSSKGWIIVITSIIGLIGTVIVAYFAFISVIVPKQQEIGATQTAQSILSTQMANNIWITQTFQSIEATKFAESILATQSAAAPVQASSNSSPTITVVPPTTEPPPHLSTINWTIDLAGVCRDDKGNYPYWTDFNWTLSQCQEGCQSDPNCQGFAMSQQANYCQLFGSDGAHGGTDPGTRITRGDRAQPEYACYLKSSDQSILAWVMDSTGICRDSAGEYPNWSEYSSTLPQCTQACRGNPNCQGFAMSKEANYCQLYGSDGDFGGSNPGTQITQGDSSQPQYTCYIKR